MSLLIFAIVVVIVAVLAAYAIERLVAQDPFCRALQALVAILAVVAIVAKAGWV